MTAGSNHSHLNQTQISASSNIINNNNNNNNNSNKHHQGSNNNNIIRPTSASNPNTINYHHQQHQHPQQQLPLNVINCSSLAFQQIKQTQASLARLSRHVHFNSNANSQQNSSQINQHQTSSSSSSSTAPAQTSSSNQTTPIKPANSHTFVDCLIRRFKNCFDEDFCEVPVFVVGNLSPGSDGTHLILPPCVSLGGQNISRFASAKNLRLLNSIRESCRSIEQLDLGGNKLNDLIEIYKILQCTPNLKFLNLSENDLSRTAPVATSSQPTGGNSSSSSGNFWSPISISFNNNNNNNYNITVSQQQQQQQYQRGYLSAINQNSTTGNTTTSFTCSRRHSSLGCGQNTASRASLRVAEARRVAAVAQQTKRGPTGGIGSRLAGVQAGGQGGQDASNCQSSTSAKAAPSNESTNSGSHHRLCTKNAASLSANQRSTSTSMLRKNASKTCVGTNKASNSVAGSHHQAGPARTKSTMHLVRSLSSLSAKDVRPGVGSRKVSDLRDSNVSKSNRYHQIRSSSSNVAGKTRQQIRMNLQASTSTASNNSLSDAMKLQSSTTNCKSSFSAEPICEADSVDVDMSDSQPNDANIDRIGTSDANANINPNVMQHQQQNNYNNHQTITIPSTMKTTGTNTIVSNNNNNNINNQQQQHLNNSKQHQMGPVNKASGISVAQHQNTTSYNNNNNNLQYFQQQQQPHPFKRTFESIKALALNNTGCQWRVVCSILSRMPNLEELHLSLNNYERIDLDPQLFRHKSLKRLYLCNNPKLTDWKELNKILIAFPSLEALSIADCNISQIPENLAQSREWRKICGLNINGWPIKEWPVIERLNELPSLIDLKCRNLALLNTIDEPRDHLIARLPNLQRLNGSEIEERDHAEKAFLRFFVTNSHLERPRRFHELIQIHGLVDAQVDVDVDLSPPSQANVRVIYLNKQYFRQNDQEDILMSEDFLNKLMASVDSNNPPATLEPASGKSATTTTANSDYYVSQLDSIDSQQQQQQEKTINTSSPNDASGNDNDNQDDANLMRLFRDETQEVVALDIDLRQSVRKFKQIIANIFGLNSQNFILYYIDHEMVGLMGPELIKHNQKKLWNYNVQNGDQFIVEEL